MEHDLLSAEDPESEVLSEPSAKLFFLSNGERRTFDNQDGFKALVGNTSKLLTLLQTATP